MQGTTGSGPEGPPEPTGADAAPTLIGGEPVGQPPGGQVGPGAPAGRARPAVSVGPGGPGGPPGLPLPGPEPAVAVRRAAPPSRALVVALVAAIVVGLAGVGLGQAALLRTPTQVVGPQGPRGQRGPAGVRGPAGTPGPAGPAGKAGPAGTVKKVEVVRPSPDVSAPDPPVGAVLVGRAACPPHTVLLGGGAQVSAPGVIADRNVELRSSFPLSSKEWQVVAQVTGPLGKGTSMTLTPYLLCGKR